MQLRLLNLFNKETYYAITNNIFPSVCAKNIIFNVKPRGIMQHLPHDVKLHLLALVATTIKIPLGGEVMLWDGEEHLYLGNHWSSVLMQLQASYCIKIKWRSFRPCSASSHHDGFPVKPLLLWQYCFMGNFQTPFNAFKDTEIKLTIPPSTLGGTPGQK